MIPLTTEDVVMDWLGGTVTAGPALTMAVTAACALVDRYAAGATPDEVDAKGKVVTPGTVGPRGITWDEASAAATLLAARLYRRRSSPEGTIPSPMGDGTVAWVARTDPDVSHLLKIGVHTPPQAV